MKGCECTRTTLTHCDLRSSTIDWTDAIPICRAGFQFVFQAIRFDDHGERRFHIDLVGGKAAEGMLCLLKLSFAYQPPTVS